jgi:hypothetical protein|tara:strand:+ start:639 stop:881 length:243 start_codon:yes stop_codon:yes gene_type:complete
LSTERRRVVEVFQIIEDLIKENQSGVTAGAVADVLRGRNAPSGMWQLRADFSQLASEGRIQCDELSGTWTPVGAPLKNVG